MLWACLKMILFPIHLIHGMKEAISSALTFPGYLSSEFLYCIMSLLRIFSAFRIQSDNYFLKPHELEPLHSEPILLKPEQPFWLLAFLLVILALLMAIRIFYRKSFSELANAFFSFRYTGQLVRD